jgi:hypothetical protein
LQKCIDARGSRRRLAVSRIPTRTSFFTRLAFNVRSNAKKSNLITHAFAYAWLQILGHFTQSSKLGLETGRFTASARIRAMHAIQEVNLVELNDMFWHGSYHQLNKDSL